MNMNRPDMTENVKYKDYTNKSLQMDSNLATMEMSKSPAIESSDQTAANQLSKLCLFTRILVPMRSTRKSFVVLHRLYAARGEITKSWAISSTR